MRENVNRIILSMVILICCISCAEKQIDSPDAKKIALTQAPRAAAESEMTLGPGDEIAISVWRNTDLDRTLIVDSAGKIRMPLAGEISVKGMTVSRLNQEITARLSAYIPKPYVDVNLRSVASRKIHVLGEVRTPGTFAYMQRMPAWEAISRAGGFTDDANKKRFLLVQIRDNEAYISVMDLDFEKAFKDGVLQDNYFLDSGDIIYVPEITISNVERFMVRLANILAPIQAVQRMVTVTPNFIDALGGKSTSNIVP